MDYEKAYNKALSRAKEVYHRGYYVSGDIEHIFPELKESEDEKNIKNLIDELKCSLRAANCQNEACNGGHEKRIALLEWAIDWLEKQGDKKPKWTEEDSSMQLMLMRDIEQISFISKEGKDERIMWLNKLDDRFHQNTNDNN